MDWKLAALAFGEIDLARLTERWPAKFVREVKVEYQSQRWPSDPSHDFKNTLVAARLFYNFKLLLHWLSYYPTRVEKEPWIIEQMHKVREELGLI